MTYLSYTRLSYNKVNNCLDAVGQSMPQNEVSDKTSNTQKPSCDVFHSLAFKMVYILLLK